MKKPAKTMNKKIRKLMLERDVKVSHVAQAINVDVSNVSAVLNGHWRSRRVQEGLAQALNISMKKLDQLWEDKSAA